VETRAPSESITARVSPSSKLDNERIADMDVVHADIGN
jgi:hypothetical protein